MVKAQVPQKSKTSTRSSVKERGILKKKILKKKHLTKQKNKDGKPKKVWHKKKTDKGVVYLSHIPHGFYEEQIESYFSQFGKVTELSLPRSKTGKAKGYAFVQFLHPEVAKIAADAMNNYLMFNRVLKAKYIPPEQQKERLFKQAKQTKETNTTRLEMSALKLKHQRAMKNRMIHTRREAKLARKLLLKCQLTKDQLKELEEEPLIEINKENVDDVFNREKALIENKKKESKGNLKKKDVSSSEQTSESLLSKHKNEINTPSHESKETALIQSVNQDSSRVLVKPYRTNSKTLKDLPTSRTTLNISSKKIKQNKNSRQKISLEPNLAKKRITPAEKTVLNKEKLDNSKKKSFSLESESGSLSTTKRDTQKALQKPGFLRSARLKNKSKSILGK